jgi:AAA domain
MTTQQTKPWPAFLSHAELMQPLPPPAWEIEPLFNQGDRVMFYGKPGARKSFMVMHMEICLAAGIPWLGKFEISQPRKVLYTDKEMGEQRSKWRYHRLVRGLGLENQELHFKLWPKPPFMVDSEDHTRLLATFEEMQWTPDVIIFDSFRRVLDGDENSSADLNSFWNEISVLSEAGITLLLIHHTNRQGGVRGSIDIDAGLDVLFEVVPCDEQGVTSINTKKVRDGEELPPLGVKMISEPGRDSPLELFFVGEGVTDDPDKTRQANNIILALLASEPRRIFQTAEILEHVTQQGISQKTGENALRGLRKNEMVGPVKKGRYRHKPVDEY